MRIDQIRRQIRAAVEEERTSGQLAAHFTVVAEARGLERPPRYAAAVVTLLTAYIEKVPDLLELCEKAARRAGLLPTLAPLLAAAEMYFLQPMDLIPDQHGLGGLSDDAYLAVGLISVASERHARETGRQIVDVTPGFQRAHAYVKELLGLAICAQLDQVIAAAIADLYPELAAGLAQATTPLEPERPLKFNDPLGGRSPDQYARDMTDWMLGH